MEEILETKRLYEVRIDQKIRYLFLTRYGRYGVLYKKNGPHFKKKKEIEMVHNTFPFHEVWVQLIRDHTFKKNPSVAIEPAMPADHDCFITDMERRKKSSIRSGMLVGYGLELLACLVGAFLLWYVPWALKQQFILSFLIALVGLIIMPAMIFVLGFLSIRLMRRWRAQNAYDVLYSSEEQTRREINQIIKDTFGIDPDDFDE